MISNELTAEILRLFVVEKWPIGTIAGQLHVHHSVVERVLRQAPGKPKSERHRASKLDEFTPFIQQTLSKFPTLCASRIHAMARERGLRCSGSHFRALVVRLRPPKRAEAFLRLRTLPGEQGQVDWAHFGTVQIGRAVRKLYAFVLVLAFSRRIFLRFGLDIGMGGFLDGHQRAFETFGGVPRVLLYDNLKSAVLQRIGDAILFHPTLSDFAAHHSYQPRPVAVARGNEKGRVERSIRYIRSSFFAARTWRDLDDLNHQAAQWCQEQSEERQWPQDHAMKVREAFEQEKHLLLPLPADRYQVAQRHEVPVHKTPYIRFDLNDYSVPHTCVQRTVVVLATAEEIRILDGSTEVARHLRCFDKGETIEEPLHISDLSDQKRHARHHRAQDRVIRAVPQVEKLLVLLASRGDSPVSAVSYLGKLLDGYGVDDLRKAVAQALVAGTPHPHNVRLVLEKIRFARGLPEPSQRPLLTDPKLRDIHVEPHDLGGYDRLISNHYRPEEPAND